LLRAIIEPVLGCWCEHESDINTVFIQVGPLFQQALMYANLSINEMEEWRQRLRQWQTLLSEDGGPQVFDEVIAAVTAQAGELSERL
jgi:hypothetical protein